MLGITRYTATYLRGRRVNEWIGIWMDRYVDGWIDIWLAS